MPLQLTEINSTQLIKDAPAILQANFTAIKNYLDSIEEKLKVDTKKLLLSEVVSVGNGGITANAVVLAGQSGSVITVMPNGATATFILNSDGSMTCTKITIPATVTENSTFQKLLVQSDFNVEGKTFFKNLVDYSHESAKIKYRQVVHTVVSSNIGASATTKIDVSKSGKRIFLNANNGGSQFNGTGTALMNIDIANLEVGQEVEMILLQKNNTDVVGFYNGISGSEIFAKIGSNGFEIVPFDHPIMHDNSTIGAKLRGVWIDVGSNTFRFLILEMSGFSIV